jgi:hypothetical protein
MRTTALTMPAPETDQEVSPVSETTMFATEHASFGMPVVDRARVQLCHLWVSTGVIAVAAEQKSARLEDVAGSDSVSTPIDAVVTGAFPGAPAWSPPI